MPVSDGAAEAASETKPKPEPRETSALGSLMADAEFVEDVAEQRLRAEPRPAFLYQHHWQSWTVETEGLEGPTLLPELVPLQLVKGVNGVRTTKAGELSEQAYRSAVRSREDQGFLTLAPTLRVEREHLPAGVPAGAYVRALKVVTKAGGAGIRHQEAWDVPVPTGPGADQRFKFDRASYNRWRLHLVETGVIPPVTDDVVSAMRATAARRVTRIKSAHIPNEDLRKAKVDEAEGEAAAVDAAADRAEGQEAAPKTPKSPKAPAAPKPPKASKGGA